MALRMFYTYIPNQKFNTMKISLIRNTIKIWKKQRIEDIKGFNFGQQ